MSSPLGSEIYLTTTGHPVLSPELSASPSGYTPTKAADDRLFSVSIPISMPVYEQRECTAGKTKACVSCPLLPDTFSSDKIRLST